MKTIHLAAKQHLCMTPTGPTEAHVGYKSWRTACFITKTSSYYSFQSPPIPLVVQGPAFTRTFLKRKSQPSSSSICRPAERLRISHRATANKRQPKGMTLALGSTAKLEWWLITVRRYVILYRTEAAPASSHFAVCRPTN